MKSFYLFLVFAFCISFSVISQSSYPLERFTNYGSCYQGLKSHDGKIIWPAEFESLELIWNEAQGYESLRYYWVAEKNGSFGLINATGDLILPFEYNRTGAYGNAYMASDDSATYLFVEDQPPYKLYNYSWIKPESGAFITDKNGQFGLFDAHLQQVLPPIYDKINFCIIQHRDEGYRKILSSRYVEIEKNKDHGIFDMTQGKWIVPLTSVTVGKRFVTECSESDAIFTLHKNKSPEFTVVNSFGREVVTQIEGSIVFLEIIPLDSCGMKSHQLAYITENNKMKVTNLSTGVSSDEYDEIYPMHGYSVFFNEKKWGVLDPSLVELKQLTYPKYSTKSINEYYLSRPSELARERFNLLFSQWYHDEIDSVLITRTEIHKKEPYDDPQEIFGLVNFRSGKRIKATYSSIRRIKFEGAHYYWATHAKNVDYYEGSEDEAVALDIYNSDLELIREFKACVGIQYQAYWQSDHFVLKNYDKWGVVNGRGETVIPLKFDKCYGKEFAKGNPNLRNIIFIAEDENSTLKIVFDYNGNVLISKNYRHLQVFGEFIIGTHENGISDFYNSEGELLMADVEAYRTATFIDPYGNCYDEIDNYHRERPKYMHVIKENYVHVFLNNSFFRLDENYLKFNEKYCFLHHWWLIDQKGKIVTLTPKGIRTRPKNYSTTYERLIECSTFINEYPVPEKDPPKPNPVVISEPIPVANKPFVWKQINASSPNRWYLYNGSGLLLYRESFEYPMPVDNFSGGVFKQNGKFGFFDSQYNQFLPAEYDFIYPNYYPITLKDGKWQFHDRNKKLVSEQYENVCIINRPFRFVFEGGKIGLLNDSLELEIPLTDSAVFIQKYDLAKLLNLQGNPKGQKFQAMGNIIRNAEPKEVYRMINNRVLLEEAYLSSTANQLLQFSPVDLSRGDLSYELKNLNCYYRSNSLRKEHRFTYYNQYFFAEMTFSWTQNANSGNSYFGSVDDKYKNRALFNYKIIGNELVPISLTDVLKSDAASTKKIDELMTKKLTEIQAFGGDCNDIESKLQLLKNNFLLAGNRIIFYWPERGSFDIELSYIELKGLILEPTKLTQLKF